jgi:YgiT-type zinc finger domain-containing protein
VRHVTRSYGKGDDLLVVTDVPVVSCTHCGESYLTAGTMHRLDQIKRRRKELAVQRSVAVADFVA